MNDQSEAERLWADFIDAKHRAEQSEKLEDGIAAGRAYGRFLSAFVPASNVVPFRGRQ